MNMIFRKRLAIFFSLTSIFILIISGYLIYTKYQTAFSENSDIVTSYQTIRAANQTLISLNEAALYVSTFLFSKDPQAIKKLPETIISAQINMTTLDQLTQDNALEIKLIKKLKALFDKKVEYLKIIISEYSTGNQDLALKIASDKSRLLLISDITQLIIEIKKIEIGQLEESTTYYKINQIKAEKFFITLGIFNVLLLLFNFTFTRRFLE